MVDFYTGNKDWINPAVMGIARLLAAGAPDEPRVNVLQLRSELRTMIRLTGSLTNDHAVALTAELKRIQNRAERCPDEIASQSEIFDPEPQQVISTARKFPLLHYPAHAPA